jgi:hypothetical protein
MRSLRRNSPTLRLKLQQPILPRRLGIDIDLDADIARLEPKHPEQDVDFLLLCREPRIGARGRLHLHQNVSTRLQLEICDVEKRSSYPRILIFAHVERRLDVARHRCLDLDVVLRTFGQPLRVQVPRLN